MSSAMATAGGSSGFAPLSFGPVAEDRPAATDLRVFDGAGRLIAYGRLAPMSRLLMKGVVAFHPRSILLKRPAAPLQPRQ
jgi:hypothetical protein